MTRPNKRSKRPGKPKTRRTQIEQLERRLVMAYIAPQIIFPEADVFRAKDDSLVVAEGSDSSEIDVLANDFSVSWSYRWWALGDASESLIETESIDKEAIRESLSVTSSENGTVLLSDDDTVLYKPNAGFTGIDKFSYTVEFEGETHGADVYVNVVDPIFALRDWYSVDAGSENNLLDVLSNDGRNAIGFGNDSSGLKIKSVDAEGLDGSVEVSADGESLIFTPSEGASGEQTFQYTIESASGHQAIATVYVETTAGINEGEQPVSIRELEQFLIEQAMNRSRGSFGAGRHTSLELYSGDYQDWGLARSESFTLTGARLGLVAVADGAGLANSTSQLTVLDSDVDFYSSTNRQDASVDEADLVKTDGKYLYAVSNWVDVDGNSQHQLVVSDVRDRSQMSVIARYALDGPAENLFLHGDRLTVLSQGNENVQVTVLDVSDPASPELEFESEVRGILRQARSVGENVYVVTQAISPHDIPTLRNVCYQSDVGCFYETASQFAARIEPLVADTADLTVTTTAADGSITTTSQDKVEGLDRGDISSSLYASSVTSFDVTGDHIGAIDSLLIAHGASSEIYVSTESIFFFESAYSMDFQDSISNTEISADDSFAFRVRSMVTEIDKVSFDQEGQLDWAASGAVLGEALNSFSLSEHEGYLRIVTHEGSSNSIYILAQNGEALEVVGSIQDIAPNEQVYSVRFEGDRGFVVTFRKVDPLFVFDFSDPTAPTKLGELKVTGYSNYLQVIDENHLLGIGREANGGGLFQEMQISIFDISDLENPQLKHRYSFDGGRDLWSPLMEDAWNLGSHQSVSYFASHETLVLPVYKGDGSWWSWDRSGSEREVSMRVLDIDLQSGISELGRVGFADSVDPNSVRAVRIGDDLLSITPNVVKANVLRQPDQLLGQLLIGAGASDDVFVMRGDEKSTLDVLANDAIGEGEAPLVDVRQPSQGGFVQVTDSGEIQFTPDPNFLGTAEFIYSVNEQDSALVTVNVKPQWHNRDRAMDVDQDGKETVKDLLNVINVLVEHGSGGIEEFDAKLAGNAMTLAKVDVNDDGIISPKDAVTMINRFSGHSTQTTTGELMKQRDEDSRSVEQNDEAISQLF